MREINKEVVKKWVKALRSGDYKQAQKKLRDGDNFCCLGVLCDLYSKEFDVPWVLQQSIETGWQSGFKILEESLILPDKVCKWLGTYLRDPEVDGKILGFEADCNLSDVNDAGLSFEKIADLIEKKYL